MERKRSFVKRGIDNFTRIDQFALPIKLFADGEEEIKSFPGAIVTLILNSIMLAYTIEQFQVLMSRSNASTQEQAVVYFYPEDYQIDLSDKNIMLAFGVFTTYDYEPKNDEEYV